MTINWNNFEYDEIEYEETTWKRPIFKEIINISDIEKSVDTVFHSEDCALFLKDKQRNRKLELKNYEISNDGIPNILIYIQEIMNDSIKLKRGFFGKQKKYVEVRFAGYSSDGIEKPIFNNNDILNIVMDFYKGKETFGGLEFMDSFWKRIPNNNDIFS